MLMNNTFWTEDLTDTSLGRYFTFSIKNRQLSRADKDYLVFVLNTSTVSAVHVHDKNFFLMSSNPLGPPINSKYILPSTPSHYQDYKGWKKENIHIKGCLKKSYRTDVPGFAKSLH